MYVVGVLAFSEQVLAEVGELNLSLTRLGYPVHPEQMGYRRPARQIGDYYYEKDALLLWICRCYGDPQRCRDAAGHFLEAGVDAILAMTPTALEIALDASAEAPIPILFTHVPALALDPLLASRDESRTIAGILDVHPELVADRLALITEVVPPPTAVHAFYNPEDSLSTAEAQALAEAARRLGLQPILHTGRDPAELRKALSGLRARTSHALFRLSDPAAAPLSNLFGAIAHEQYIPYVGLEVDELERCAALFALDVQGTGDQAASLLDRLLRGDLPAGLTTLRPTRQVLAVNRQAARDLGLIIAPRVLAAADTVLPAKERTSIRNHLMLILVVGSVLLSLLALLATQLESLVAVGVILGAVLFLVLLLWFYLDRSIVRPVQKLMFAAEKIGAGDLSSPIGEAPVEDEIGILARALRRMRGNLSSSYAELERITCDLEQRIGELGEAYRALQATQHELEQANRRVIAADDSSRFALTTYIHDEILGLLDELGEAAQSRGDPRLAELAGEVDLRVRRLRFDLSVPILHDAGVELRRLIYEILPQVYPEARRVRLDVDLSALDTLGSLEPAYRVLVYRFVRGALSNSYRHAGPHTVQVRAGREEGHLTLSVTDDGAGFDPAAVDGFIQSGHYFFHDIQIRAQQLKGSFQVQSHPGAGTCLAVRLPLRERAKTTRGGVNPSRGTRAPKSPPH